MLEGVARGVTRLKEIMNDMVSVIRVELADQHLNFVPVSIPNLINTVAAELQDSLASRELTLVVEPVSDLPPVLGDFKQLHAALLRIAGNAIKYTPDGGKITISTGVLQKSAESDPAFVQIIIADTGVGIAIEKQKMIFESFGTAEDVSLHSTGNTKFMGGGAGLGLTIAKGVISAHNGRIWVKSDGFDKEKLPGSKFFILLPAQE
jgi:signal transduction histidine kinase